MNGQQTLADILGQADGWAAGAQAAHQAADRIRDEVARLAPRHILVSGCGSPYFLAESAVSLWSRPLSSRAIVTAAPASELLDSAMPLAPWPADTILVLISRSGSTTEVLDAVEAFREAGGASVWAITCRSQSPLAEVSDVVLAADAGYESSVAQTRSFSSMLVAVEGLGDVLAGRLPSTPERVAALAPVAIADAAELVDRLDRSGVLTTADRVDYLGAGARFGLAREAMLKMTEMALTHSSSYQFLEYRHGPKSLVDERTLVVGLVDDVAAPIERGVLNEVAGLGATTAELFGRPDRSLVALMPTLQLLAHRRACGVGVDPDEPRHLTAVVHLDPARRPVNPPSAVTT